MTLSGPSTKQAGRGELPQPVVNIPTPERLATLAAGAALVGYGAWRRSLPGAAMAAAGGLLLARGNFGYCPLYGALGRNVDHDAVQQLDERLTVACTPDEAYRVWKSGEWLAGSGATVETAAGGRQVYRLSLPAGVSLACAAEIEEDRPGQCIVCRAVDGSLVPFRGEVRFSVAPEDTGCDVGVRLQFLPCGGLVCESLTSLARPLMARGLRAVLEQFKRTVEDPQRRSTTEGPASVGSMERTVVTPPGPDELSSASDPVIDASDDSFPASDPPTWTATSVGIAPQSTAAP